MSDSIIRPPQDLWGNAKHFSEAQSEVLSDLLPQILHNMSLADADELPALPFRGEKVVFDEWLGLVSGAVVGSMLEMLANGDVGELMQTVQMVRINRNIRLCTCGSCIEAFSWGIHIECEREGDCAYCKKQWPCVALLEEYAEEARVEAGREVQGEQRADTYTDGPWDEE